MNTYKEILPLGRAIAKCSLHIFINNTDFLCWQTLHNCIIINPGFTWNCLSAIYSDFFHINLCLFHEGFFFWLHIMIKQFLTSQYDKQFYHFSHRALIFCFTFFWYIPGDHCCQLLSFFFVETFSSPLPIVLDFLTL